MSSKTLALLPSAHGRTAGAVIESSIGRIAVTEVFDAGGSRAAAAGPFDRVVATLEAGAAAFRVLSLPFRDRRRVSQAVGPALEEHVPYDLDDGVLSWDYAGGSAGSGSTVLAAIVESARVEAARAAIADSSGGDAPQRLVWAPTAVLAAYRRALGEQASFTAVDLSERGAVVARFAAGELAALRIVAPCDDELLLRNTLWSLATVDAAVADADADAGADAGAARLVAGGRFAARLAQTLSERLGGRTVESLPPASPLEGFTGRDWREWTELVGLILVASGDAPSPVLDFEAAASSLFGVSMLRDLQDEARPLLRWGAAALVLGIAAVGIDYVQLFAERRVLAARAEQIYASVMPSGSGGAGRKLKMEMRLRELSGKAEAGTTGAAGSPLALLATLSREVPKNLDVTLDQLDHVPNAARISGHAASFETVTKMQEALQKGGGFARVEVKDVHAAVSGSGVDFLLEIGTTPAEAGA